MALSIAAQEGEYVKTLLEEIGVLATLVVRCDSSSARAIVARRGMGRLKHISIRLLWLQDEVRSGAFVVDTVKSLANPADLFTKVAQRARHEQLCSLVGLAMATSET